MSPFELVWEIVGRVPRGKVVTYGQISQMIDRRLTPVGVGWAIRAAPDGAIAWQRVVNARGGISTDGEHPGLQRAILEKEKVRFRGDGTIDLGRYGWLPEEPLKKAPAKRAPAKKAPAKKASGKRAPAKKASLKKGPSARRPRPSSGPAKTSASSRRGRLGSPGRSR